MRVTSAGSYVLLAWRVASLSGGEACRPCSFSMLLLFVFPDCLAHPFGSRIRSEGCGAEGIIGGGLISAWGFSLGRRSTSFLPCAPVLVAEFGVG